MEYYSDCAKQKPNTINSVTELVNYTRENKLIIIFRRKGCHLYGIIISLRRVLYKDIRKILKFKAKIYGFFLY